jgi:hypothetical protein
VRGRPQARGGYGGAECAEREEQDEPDWGMAAAQKGVSSAKMRCGMEA